jgi:hypothetical protein
MTETISAETLADLILESTEAVEKKQREEAKRYESIVPKDRNFDIVIDSSGLSIKITLVRCDGRKKVLNTFLPLFGWFAKGEKFVCEGNKKVTFEEGEISKSHFLLSLFHEIGHARSKVKRRSSLAVFKAGFCAWKTLYAKLLEEEKKGKGKGKEFIEKEKVSFSIEKYFPDWYKDEDNLFRSASERDAWTYALRTLKQLEKEGYDVFSGFESKAQVRGYVRYCLKTYLTDLLLNKLLSFDVEGMRELNEHPLFCKEKENPVAIRLEVAKE